MHTFRASLAPLVAAAISASAPVRAGDPPLWDAAREPRRARDVRAMREAESVLLETHLRGGPRARLMLMEALRTLERIDAPASPDPRVRFLHGRLLQRVGRDVDAVEALRAAIAFAPSHPSVSEAWFSLAVSFARLGRTEEEIRAYDEWLAREPSAKDRAVGYSNQAEGYMAAGKLHEAVRGYRRAVDLAHDNALAHWGLAVALDRSGNPAGALREAAAALTYDPDAKQLGSPNVFFVPARDRFWYRALGAMARAQSAPDDALRSLWWDRATLLWQQYLDAAPVDDRWAPIARIRHAFCERATREARSRARSP